MMRDIGSMAAGSPSNINAIPVAQTASSLPKMPYSRKQVDEIISSFRSSSSSNLHKEVSEIIDVIEKQDSAI